MIKPTRIAGFRTAKALAYRALRRNDCLGYDNAYDAIHDARRYPDFTRPMVYEWESETDRLLVEYYILHVYILRLHYVMGSACIIIPAVS